MPTRRPRGPGQGHAGATSSAPPPFRTEDFQPTSVLLKTAELVFAARIARSNKLDQSGTAAMAPSKAERRVEAKVYEAEMCKECGNFTLVRNGTCIEV
jgi:hypothetical protein